MLSMYISLIFGIWVTEKLPQG